MSRNSNKRDEEYAIISGLRVLGQSDEKDKTGNDNQTSYREYGSIPLKSVAVKAAVIHGLGDVEITQVYKNESRDRIETVYFFPIESCGAVTSFHAEFNDGHTVTVGLV